MIKYYLNICIFTFNWVKFLIWFEKTVARGEKQKAVDFLQIKIDK